LCLIESKHYVDALADPNWTFSIQDEINQFGRNQVWSLTARSNDHPMIATKWVFRDKLDETNIVTRNKVRLVAKGYNHKEGIDFDELCTCSQIRSHSYITRISISQGVKLFSMDVKCDFLNGFLNEEVYVEQSLWFEISEFSNYVLKLHKTLYGLKQAPKTWYESLTKFLLENDSLRGKIDKLFSFKPRRMTS